ncbi:phosphatidylinositol 4-phosphate 5-kinase 7 [Mercurialis annua]|uniref:phosphatidylinositol 4-phosphate 5-kinase 7 n=1 Tax=Mercurialis annua TaxID=3986 RepID=UPI002161020B|nr:phosphatidylinositol 4-phosphate 5-kinase 7 [Mercurialis annua]XP_050210027.1 phosphatidylinositol 4-phosphate 5-kinase 7 [Mercurialis annua]XP_050210028.1 phosphatidylinositol 4-phosphate 5-kinase 7 [Mercurialis annua]XP_050210029.1 phosphatidylinositol 4-phosphate 5-kinase 7 [Mercurialis annua]
MVGLKQLLNQEDNERLDATVLSNKDTYSGEFKGVLPHGKGKYTWTDGTVYQGDWEEGKMTGKGRIIWPSGANYEGDFCGGYLHGFGTLIGPDRSQYRGAWRMNIQHGLGRKEYSNSDIYEGSWKEGVHEGSGKYSWNSGHTYIGNWKGGKMNERGVMKWENGDLFDGYWLNNLRNGSGVYMFADGGCYFGTWSRGLKDGKGTFYPAGTKLPSLRRWCTSLGHDESGRSSLSHSSSLNSVQEEVPKPSVMRSFSEKISVGGMFKTSGQPKCGTNSLDENCAPCGSSGRMNRRTYSLNDKLAPSESSRELISNESSHMFSEASDVAQKELQGKSTVIYEREYMQGVLVKERIKTVEKSSKSKQKSKFQVKVKKNSCVDFFEGHQSYYLMLNLQLGIRYTVGKITPVPRREVRTSDFGDRARISMYFPRKGSQFTPPHYSIDFYWKDYCPMVFRNLREMFKLDAAEYMMSICGDDGLRELSSPGKSGSIFYLSHDDRFVIKTLKKSELKFFLRMLPNYYDHVGRHENTLITKFFGVHRIKLRGGRKVRFVVMGNMFCTELKIHRCYDLKGSTHGRFTDADKIQANTTLKDLDLTYEFQMDKLLRESLFRQLSEDCLFLQSQHIIDYSLLLGLHFRAPEQLKAILESTGALPNPENLPSGEGITSQGEPFIPTGLLLVTHEPNSVNTAPGPHIRGNTLRAYSVGAKEVDLLLPGTGRLRVQLGVNMPAQASRKLRQEVDSMEVELFEVYDVVLYMGIIDILQEYNVTKKVENKYKSLKFDPLSISAVEPKLYADRFLKFLQQKVFPEKL